MREYLLYCILEVLNATGQRVKLPPKVKGQNVSAEHWLEHGKKLAGGTPVKYLLPPDVILGHLREALGSTLSGQKRNTPESSQDQEGPSGTRESDMDMPAAQAPRMTRSSLHTSHHHTSHLAGIFKASSSIGCNI